MRRDPDRVATHRYHDRCDDTAECGRFRALPKFRPVETGDLRGSATFAVLRRSRTVISGRPCNSRNEDSSRAVIEDVYCSRLALRLLDSDFVGRQARRSRVLFRGVSRAYKFRRVRARCKTTRLLIDHCRFTKCGFRQTWVIKFAFPIASTNKKACKRSKKNNGANSLHSLNQIRGEETQNIINHNYNMKQIATISLLAISLVLLAVTIKNKRTSIETRLTRRKNSMLTNRDMEMVEYSQLFMSEQSGNL
ncbi:hypothetical protein EAG_12422 [Camponotus floridanus]|uniref:Uncharacterized protein n=1 Tax=Camponotus floridanus TaxID=104421 RepID=E2AWF9_CAMFO|nr:hypothetical protein EAG_12422 [Camponotus floridanus]